MKLSRPFSLSLFLSLFLTLLTASAAPPQAAPATTPAVPTAVAADAAARAEAATEPAPAERAPPRRALVHRALIISVDGLRPDLILRGNTPIMHHLYENGTFTFWARTTVVSVTLPSHVSMLTGVNPQRHGITWNDDLPLSKPIYPASPTIFELAHAAGYSTAIVAGKTKFDILAKPKTVDYLSVPPTDPKKDVIPNREVVANALEIINTHQPQVLFVHLADVDVAGHKYGWASPEQMAAIENSDAAIGQVLDAYRKANLLDSTFIIVTSDHGGQGLSHGPEDARSRSIPWIASGPGIRKGYDLTRIGTLDVKTEDTFATTAYMLGLHVDPKLDGKPVLQILDRAELIRDNSEKP